MNFFEHQDKANKKTSRLIIFFILGLVLTIGAANAVIYFALYFAALDSPVFYQLIEQPIWIYISGFFVIMMGLGTLIKTLQIASGGLSVARMVHARPLSEGPQNFKEERFIHVVEEMAIASGTPVPHLFVMEEPSINAFVAGTKMENTVMVVTTGALEALNREELQAVVGHEFSHIFNGDMKISLKLIGVLGGILMIGKIGELLLRMRIRSTSSSRKGNGAFVIVLMGLGLFLVGYVGLFFGRLMKAAVSRQRELLADACSVQYTRNPHGLASAFKVMQMHQAGTHLKNKNAEDISHLCFGPAQWVMFSNLLGTHPPLEARIRAIDPNGIYSILPRDGEGASLEGETKAKQVGFDELLPMAAGAILHTNSQAVEASIATPGDNHVAYAMALVAAIPEAIRVAARNTDQIESLIYALLIHRETDKASIESFCKEKFNPQTCALIAHYDQLLESSEAASLLPIFDLTLSSFYRLDQSQQKLIYQNGLEILEQVNGSPFHFALLTILYNQIKANQPKKPTIHKLDSVLKELTYILAILLSSGHQSLEEQEACFKKEMAKITKRKIAYPRIDNFQYGIMTKMLARLNQVTPLGKEIIIRACIQCVMNDNQVMVAEGELLRAICEALNCPIPPIIAHPE